jgi:hypothetical protein
MAAHLASVWHCGYSGDTVIQDFFGACMSPSCLAGTRITLVSRAVVRSSG